jgi:hypothetical protein
VLLDPERILADEVRRDALDRLLLGAEELVARDAVETGVGVDPQVTQADPGHGGAGRPGGMEGRRQVDVHLPRANRRDAHRPSARSESQGRTSSPSRPDVLVALGLID